MLPQSTGGGRILDFVNIFYRIAIPAILGFMLFHNGLDWWKKARRTWLNNGAAGRSG